MKSIYLLLLFVFFPAYSFADYTITCESQSGRYTICRSKVDRRSDVSLVRRLSKSSCERGYSWGVANGGVWVDRGCRAQFRIHEYRYNDGGYDSRYEDNRGQGYYDYERREGVRQRNERERQRLEKERQELRRERKRLQAERRELQIEKRLSCPAGARKGRCSQSERNRGCKDWKENGTLPCKSGG